MKILKLVVLGLVLFLSGTVQGQISVRFSLGAPPMWAPVQHTQARYYYLPDIEAYYDVQSSMFIYLEGRNWVHRSYLPNRYRDYNLYGGYKVSMDNYHGTTPYSNFHEYKKKYARGHNREFQRTIGEQPHRGNASKQDYRESNQANRGRYEPVLRNEKHSKRKSEQKHNN